MWRLIAVDTDSVPEKMIVADCTIEDAMIEAGERSADFNCVIVVTDWTGVVHGMADCRPCIVSNN